MKKLTCGCCSVNEYRFKKIAINRFVAKDCKKHYYKQPYLKRKTSENTPVILYTSI